MSKHRRLQQFGALAACGGLLLQVAGCASGLGPILLSVVESGVLRFLLGGVVL